MYATPLTSQLSDPTRVPPCDVIIVEDEPIARRALCTLMIANGFAARAFASAEDALQVVAATGVPAIVLVDFNLPGMNGIEFIRRVAQANAAVFPVLITGAANDVLDDIRCSHQVACFRKPLDLGCLLRLIAARPATN